MKHGGISDCHPAVSFCYFALVLVFAMGIGHPACAAIALASGIALGGGGKRLWWLLPLGVVTVVINGLCNHQGMTVLTYLPWGNPLTLESLLYGCYGAILLMAVTAWFSCYNKVMTSEKLTCLFGRIIPMCSLLLTMILRFVPRLTEQGRRIIAARRALGQKKGGFRQGTAVLSCLVTWSLETAVTTADSMKSRGYGLPGRTAYTDYRFHSLDGQTAVLMGICAGGTVWGWAAGALEFRFTPGLYAPPVSFGTVLALAAYAALCSLPLLLGRKERALWKSSSSVI